MAEANGEKISVDLDESEGNAQLKDIFLAAWNIYEELEETTLPFNSAEFQAKVKSAMEHLELATRIVSRIGMFSSNELIDEVSTDSLQYLLLPFFLGKLALKIHQEDRVQVLNVAEIYFKDYLQRCEEYELCSSSKKDESKKDDGNQTNSGGNELAELMRAAHSRNDKIAQFRIKKELEERIKQLKTVVRSNTVDDEVKREFFIKFMKKSIIDAREELDSLQLERQMAEMRKVHMSEARQQHNESGQSGSHGHQHHHQQPKRKPLQPFIITRDATQKAVFGLGYPSLPVMTVDEFYQQRVEEGIFPDEEKVARMNREQAIAAAKNENEKEDEEKAAIELQIEKDDPEHLERMRRMDEYKDVVRRGDGNRYNRS